MFTLKMGYKCPGLETAVQYTQEGRKWQVVKNSNAEPTTAVKTNKLFSVGTPLHSVDITCQEMVDLLTGVMDAYDALVAEAATQIDCKFYADGILPGEVERFSKPIPQMSFPVTMNCLPVMMSYMGQNWRYDTTHNYWFPLNKNVDFGASNTPPTFFIDSEYAPVSKCEPMSPECLVSVVADIINCFTSLGTEAKAGVYNYVLLEG